MNIVPRRWLSVMLGPNYATAKSGSKERIVQNQDDLKDFAHVLNYLSDGDGVTVYSASEFRIDR
jgi:hypothetical protein